MAIQQQKALLLQEVGKPLVLVRDHKIPQPGPSQVQIKNTIAGLNPHDQKGRDLGIMVSSLPYVLANDVVGTISKLGEHVQEYAVGDRVMFLGMYAPGTPQSGLQEYSVADVSNLCRIPDRISDNEAATIPNNLFSVFTALFLTLDISGTWLREDASAKIPKSFLIVGGGSNCGIFAVQMAHAAGIPNIITVGGDATGLKALGAAHVIDRHGGEDMVVKQVREIVGDNLIYALDAVNPPEELGVALKSLSNHQRGKLARMVPHPAVPEDAKRGHEVLDVFGNIHFKDPLSVSFWRKLPDLIVDGLVRPTQFKTVKPVGLDADAVNAVLDDYRDGRRVIKPHVSVQG